MTRSAERPGPGPAAGHATDARWGTIATPQEPRDRTPSVPRTRNVSMRPKDTSRADARRRYRDEQRASGVDADGIADGPSAAGSTAAAAPASRPAFAFPDIRADLPKIAALERLYPRMYRDKPVMVGR